MSIIVRRFIPQVCSNCKGEGFIKDSETLTMKECKLCHGTGKIEIREEVETTPDFAPPNPWRTVPNPWGTNPHICKSNTYCCEKDPNEFEITPQWRNTLWQ
jgi:hypothetical protein